MNRRQFLPAAVAPLFVPRRAFGANSRIQVGLIGFGGRARFLMEYIGREVDEAELVAVADCYDAIARPRVYRRTRFLPHQILELFLRESGTGFDPLLVKVFIGMIGVYPLGSLVALDTGEIGIVTQIPEDIALITRPTVCLLKHDDGYQREQTVSLTAVDPDSGAYLRTITNPLDPADYGIRTDEFFAM